MTLRRKDREQTEEFAWQVADAAPFACLGLVTPEGEPYQVPISPAREGNCFYFHCALEGKKLDCLTANPKVCLSFVTGVEPIPEQYTTRYQSALVFGTAYPVTQEEEKRLALKRICQRYAASAMDGYQEEANRLLSRTGIWKIQVESITGKEKK